MKLKLFARSHVCLYFLLHKENFKYLAVDPEGTGGGVNRGLNGMSYTIPMRRLSNFFKAESFLTVRAIYMPEQVNMLPFKFETS